MLYCIAYYLFLIHFFFLNLYWNKYKFVYNKLNLFTINNKFVINQYFFLVLNILIIINRILEHFLSKSSFNHGNRYKKHGFQQNLFCILTSFVKEMISDQIRTVSISLLLIIFRFKSLYICVGIRAYESPFKLKKKNSYRNPRFQYNVLVCLL